MSQEIQLPAGVKVVAKCSDCQHFVKNFSWEPGAKCPKCKSPHFAPILLISDAFDYSVADRTKGYAIEDIRFAKMALWSGLITTIQYNEALSRQKAIADRKEPVPHIGRILVDMGAIKDSDMEAILEVRCKARPATDDVDFARLAEGNEYCTEQQIAECEEVMEVSKRQGHDAPPISFLLLEKRYIKENQALAIIRSQQKRRLGIIHDVRVAIEEGKPLSAVERYIGLKGDPKRKYKIGAVVGGVTIFMLWYVFSYWGVGAYVKEILPFGHAYVGYHCMKCGENFIAREYAIIPIKCPQCGKLEAYYGFHCNAVLKGGQKCNNFFGSSTRDLSQMPKCTRCGKGAFVEPITQAVLDQAKAPPRDLKARGE